MKNKHAKGPDGQPLVSFNSGRGRGRPKKNANMFPMAAIHNLARPQGASLIDPTLDLFFTASDKTGGPTDIVQGFQYVYTEIFIRKGQKKEETSQMQESENSEQSEPVKKKRGRKPKSYYDNLQKQETKEEREQQEAENEEQVFERSDEFKKHALYSILIGHSARMESLLSEQVTVKPLELPIEEVPTTGYRNLTHPTLTQICNA